MLEHSVISKYINQAQQNIETINIITLGQKQDLNSRLYDDRPLGRNAVSWPIGLFSVFNTFAFRSRSL
jgi:hypothetical protein